MCPVTLGTLGGAYGFYNRGTSAWALYVYICRCDREHQLVQNISYFAHLISNHSIIVESQPLNKFTKMNKCKEVHRD